MLECQYVSITNFREAFLLILWERIILAANTEQVMSSIGIHCVNSEFERIFGSSEASFVFRIFGEF
jgi:hypothetical protein